MSRVGGWALVVLLLAAPAFAETPTEIDKQARAHFKKGITAYNLGDYDTAVTELKKSYELSSAAPLLFNLAQAYRAQQDFGKALLFYRNYLRLVPGAPNRSDAEMLAIEMEQRVAAAEKAAADERRRRATAEEAARHAAEEEARRRAADDAAARRNVPLPAPAMVATTAPLPPKPLHKRWYFWTGIIGGVVVVGATAGALAATVGVKTVLPSGSLGTIDGRQ